MLELKLESGRRWLSDEKVRISIEEFGACRGCFQGSVFLLASGPSASDFPLFRYADWPVIAMNGSIVRCVEQGVRPFFYICDDPGFVRHRPELAALGARQATHLAMSLNCFQALHEQDPALLAQRDSVMLLERVNRMHGLAERSDRSYAWSVRNDPDLIWEEAGKAIQRAREGGGPTLIEIETVRLEGHFMGDAEGYRSEAEMAGLTQRDAILLYRARLEAEGVAKDALDELERQARQEVAHAIAFARAGKAPNAEQAMEKVFA